MDETAVLEHLEALAHSLGLKVRYERLEGETAFSSGGLCRVKGMQLIIVNSEADVASQIQTLVRALKRFDLNSVYIKPALRELLEQGAAGDP